MKILVINPGSTSTKMAVYENETPILLRNIAHSAEELAPFGNITEQQDFRRQLVLDELKNADIPLEFDAVIGRGGLVKPISGAMPATWDVCLLMRLLPRFQIVVPSLPILVWWTNFHRWLASAVLP